MNTRRTFIKYLAASPLYAGLPGFAQSFAEPAASQAVDGAIIRAGDALDVFDFEPVARTNIPPAHWGYLVSGVDGEETLKANRDAYSRYQLHARRMVDVSKIDTSVELLGARFESPIILCPLGAQKAFHPEGEIAVARAAKARGHLQILSTVTSTGVEEVIAARGAPVWFQLYTTSSFDITTKLVKRAEAAGCPAVAVTVDLPAGRNIETALRWARTDTRTCTACHAPGGSLVFTRPMFSQLDTTGLSITSSSLTWDFIKRLKDVTKMKVLIKGLESGADARLAVANGADGIIVSNHGGRATDTGRGTLECLPEVVAEVRGRVPVIVDGGVRRGTDVLKALALGATAVGIGRPYIWGLGAYGQAGVDRVLELLDNELRLAMVGVGARNLHEITRASIVRPA
ncbi:MAG: 4-hydroxymandelate oxidase [Gammaproteobacteria bacterium]|jgi:isopentenyl diphosphate isomerase/L-lactate dehydrogenase-like FMN-dependent dehydrogenase|nr:4-hydroxymandelate oxidase [Gammaproteobacteria bacterium]